MQILLLGRPRGHRGRAAKADPAPVLVDRGLPLAPVAGRAMDIRHHKRDPPVDERGEMREVRAECGPRLALGPAMWVEDRRRHGACIARAGHETRDLTVGPRDADQLSRAELFGGHSEY